MRISDWSSDVCSSDLLLQFGVEFLEINRAHPYLLTIQGPATAAVIARHTKQCLKVLLKFGIDMDRAMAVYSTVANVAYAWGAQTLGQKDPEVPAKIVQAYSAEMGEYYPLLEKKFRSGAVVYRRWLLLCINGMREERRAPEKKDRGE